MHNQKRIATKLQNNYSVSHKTGNETLYKKRPMIKTSKTPNEIMRSKLTENEIITIAQVLELYERSRENWIEYRKKLPPALCIQLTDLLAEMRKHGYIAPLSINGAITWHVILTNSKNETDDCAGCIEGTCRGRVISTEQGKVFRPCWHGRQSVFNP